MKAGIARPLRAVFGLLLLITVLVIVSGYVREFRSSQDVGADVSEPTTTSPTPASAQEGEGDEPGTEGEASSNPESAEEKAPVYVIVGIDGLNLRSEADRASASQKGLKKGDRLILLSETGGWYEVRTEDGEQGWVSSNSTYTSIEGR